MAEDNLSVSQADVNEFEAWRTVSNSNYSVSNLGRVRRDVSYRGLSPKILEQMPTHAYLAVGIWIKGSCKHVKVHKLVAEAFMGPRPPGMQINHIDGNPRNNILANLEYVTAQENMKHASDKGLLAGISEQTDEIVKRILAMKANGYTREQIRLETHISRASISRICGKKPRDSSRHMRGTSHFRSKLNEDDVRNIRLLASKGETYVSIAIKMRVSEATVGRIAKNKEWKHVA